MYSFKQFNEASYEGNVGIMELIKFKKQATPIQRKEFEEHLKNKRHKNAWDLVQKVTGTALHKSAFGEPRTV